MSDETTSPVLLRLAQLNKKYGSPEYPIARLGSELVQPGWIPTGNILMDVILFGGYGYQEGLITEVNGMEGSGKSKHCQRSIRAAQLAKPDQYVAVLAAERGDYTPEALADAGIDPDRLIVIQDMPAEDMLQTLLDLCWDEDRKAPTEYLSLWVIDSAPMLVTRAQLGNPLVEQDARAELARCYSRFIPKINMHQGSSCGLIVNQLRVGQGTMPADKKPHTPCGAALRYAEKVRVRFYDHAVKKETTGEWSEQHDTSMRICMEAVKNNLVRGARGARCFYNVYLMETADHALGVDETECLVRASIIVGLITKKGSWCHWGEYKANSIENFVKVIKEAGCQERLETDVRSLAQANLAKSRMPLGRLVITYAGELADASEVEDINVQSLELDSTEVDELTDEVINNEEEG